MQLVKRVTQFNLMDWSTDSFWGFLFVLLLTTAVVLGFVFLLVLPVLGDSGDDAVDGIATRCRLVPDQLEIVGVTSYGTLTVFNSDTRRLYTIQIGELPICEDVPIADWYEDEVS